MRIKLDTVMAHPTLGVANAGDIIDLPEAEARAMLEAGCAEPVSEEERTPIAIDVAKQNEVEADRRAAQMVRASMQTTDDDGWLKS
jgi:hypothetical protein